MRPIVGGQPRKENRREDDPAGGAAPRGRATGKAAVIGAVERGGRVVARLARELSGKGILRFFQEVVSPRQTVVITDAYAAYRKVTQESYHHGVINHSVAYADGCVHTNTIEGFWFLLKRAWYGFHHHYRAPRKIRSMGNRYGGMWGESRCYFYGKAV